MYYKDIDVSFNDVEKTISVEWFYHHDHKWTGVSLIQNTIPVAPWANKEALCEELLIYATENQNHTMRCGFELNREDYYRLAECGLLVDLPA